MICHRSHAQEILSGEVEINDTSSNIRKLALDIEQLRTNNDRIARRIEDNQDAIGKLEDKLFESKVSCYILQFLLVVAISAIVFLVLKKA